MNLKSPRLIVPVVIVGALALWGAEHLKGRDTALPSFHTVVADRGTVSQRVVAHGTVQPLRTVEVGSQVSGIIDAIHVDFNSPVRRGQVIAQIDSATFAAAVRSAEAELRAAEASVDLASAQWRRAEALGAQAAITDAEAEQARATLRNAEAQLSVRRNALDRALRELERCTILAPVDGIVISRNVDVGQTVAASLSAPILFSIATGLDLMHIHASVSEADIGRVHEGQRIRFQVDAHRGRDFTGEVVQVRNAPLQVDNVVHYETIIAVSNRERLLKPGMTAEVAIITAEVQDAVRVRNTALRARLPDALRPPDPETDATAGGATFGRLYVLREGRVLAIAVRTGLSDGVHTEILAGLAAGDSLVVGLALRGEGGAEARNLLRGDQATF